jgi:hypothetical protein
MFYKILYRAAGIALGLGLLIVAGILEAEQKYGKQRREEQEKMDKAFGDLKKMNEITKNFTLTSEQFSAAFSKDIVKETYDLIGEIYAGIEPAEKKMISMEGYFLTYHKARALKEQLTQFKKFVTDSLHSDELFRSDMMNFEERGRKGKKVSWENYYFENASKDSAMSYLRQMMASVMFAETELIKRKQAYKSF